MNPKFDDAAERASKELLGDAAKSGPPRRHWIEGGPHRLPPRECVAAARTALDKTYALGQGQLAVPLIIEAVDWLRRALEQMAVAQPGEERP